MLTLRPNALLVRRMSAARPTTRAATVLRAYKGQEAVKGAASKAQSAMASFKSDDVQDKIADFGEDLKAAWEKTDDKPAVVVLGSAALVALIAANAVVSTVDRVPVLSSLMQLVGLIVSGWFTYRYLAFKPDREELLRNVDAYLTKVLGKK